MVSKSKHLISLVLVFLIAACVLVAAGAQQSAKKSGNRTVTGCLQKGDEAGEFSLTADDGKLYDLKSSSVKLAEHVGHKVTVSGKFKPEAYEKGEEKEEAKEGGKKEAGDITVSSLKMVSSSCQ